MTAHCLGEHALIRADYHFHTEYSYDSHTTAERALEEAVKSRLDVLCVTDHDTIEGALTLKGIPCPAVHIIVGCEFTCEDGSHIIGLDLKDMIPDKGIFPIMEKITMQGGVVLLPHLFRRGSGIFRNEMRRTADFVRQVLARTDIVECFNGKDTYEHNQQSYRFVLKYGLPAVAGSDAHTPADIGSTFVEYDDTHFAHGISPHRVFFSPQAPATENPVKRKVMEFYHLHKQRFPPTVRRAYRLLKTRMTRPPPQKMDVPRVQYAFPLAPEPSAHGH
jgi:predicted metal-dependent phosphoesterase TrpH